MQPGNDNEYIIRQMEKKDIEQVERIEKEIFSIPWSAHSFEDAAMTKENIYLVCECNGVIAGYCGLWTVLGEGNITNMAVDKEYRKKGIGEALMKEMEKRGRQKDVDIFFLEVRQSNAAARRLYDKMGYKEIGTRKRFYERPVEDAIVMSKMY
ncbi:MAG: ribosomal protein S18-alanine N-acetyltransferase [Lachnospira sp.]|nr:ribosomal protein S18-alanine N-acetyltransferase [Lachnospira sp.]MDD5829535.1 ribosomal protein S18-alanine N-acetyltransferase [Lachnospira sp.]